MGGFCELLRVDVEGAWFDAAALAGFDDEVFHLDRPFFDLADLDGDVAARFHDALHFPHGLRDVIHPLGGGCRKSRNRGGINPRKPAAQPVVLPVVHHIQKRRGCDDQLHGPILDVLHLFRQACADSVFWGEHGELLPLRGGEVPEE